MINKAEPKYPSHWKIMWRSSKTRETAKINKALQSKTFTKTDL